MKSLSDGLPTEIARKIHPDWRRNETDYWAKRDELLAEYHGQWIGFANGRILVSGMSPVEVFHKAQATGEHSFVTCVGYEHEPSRMRRDAQQMAGTGQPKPPVGKAIMPPRWTLRRGPYGLA